MPPDVWTADDAADTPAANTRFRRGDAVDRLIDREWFPASVTDAYREDGVEYYDLAYADDGGHTEADAPARAGIPRRASRDDQF